MSKRWFYVSLIVFSKKLTVGSLKQTDQKLFKFRNDLAGLCHEYPEFKFIYSLN